MSLFFYAVALLIGVFQGTSTECHPAVIAVRFDGEHDSAISRRMNELYVADQAEREPGSEMDIPTLIENDRLRREEVMGYLQAGQIVRSTQLFQAALIFQHGDCPEHFSLAADLAKRADELGHPDADWLYAAATDRYLLNTGRLQRYGTQYTTDSQGHFALCPVAAGISDEERAEWGLPPLAELQVRANEYNEIYEVDPHPLAPLGRIPIIGWFVNQVFILWHCLS